ncbi:NAD(P)-dependent alcohol dehydrogenase [Nocardia sp. alder85J]|uniref:NAD(P)-dependent alcohol dehydrogenase n=1 Tax=Nocardia sp. alder85J TaxID=2862949 RepID=UPI001CD70BBC|nr:NAD(P)-dependent alcohol dehydrogenase [Nocardia sp. alder85J]MCX4096816.1 NAD(P)-dependent alcohol dehydrogenase [Nocardia sp. alder85J]
MRTRAALLRDPAAPYSLEDIELGEPRDDELLVRIVGAGMCHTDLIPRLIPIFPVPMVLGHEGAGVVEAVGRGITGIAPGDHVVLSFESCGHCARCHTGEPAYCQHFDQANTSGLRLDGSAGATSAAGESVANRWFGQGSFAGHAVATARNVVPVDKELPLEILAPLGCGIQTGAASVLLAMNVRAGDSIAVFGAGAVGLSAVMAAAVAGASEIIAVDLNPGRRELAAELGATVTYDGADPEIAEKIKDRTRGGVNYAFDTTGVPGVAVTALSSLAIRGFLGLVGIGFEELRINPLLLGGGRSLSYLLEGGAVPQTFVPRLIDLWQRGKFPFEKLIKTYPLADIDLAEADARKGDTVKPVLLPQQN